MPHCCDVEPFRPLSQATGEDLPQNRRKYGKVHTLRRSEVQNKQANAFSGLSPSGTAKRHWDQQLLDHT